MPIESLHAVGCLKPAEHWPGIPRRGWEKGTVCARCAAWAVNQAMAAAYERAAVDVEADHEWEGGRVSRILRELMNKLRARAQFVLGRATDEQWEMVVPPIPPPIPSPACVDPDVAKALKAGDA